MTVERMQRRIGRRDFGRLAAAAGVTAFVAPRLARAAPNLTVFEWSGYDDASFCPDFVEKHGSTPNYVLFGDEEEAFQKVRSGFQVDLTHPCTSSVGRWRDAGVIKPIDTDRIERWGNIPDALTATPGVQHEGQTWFMPFDWGNTTIIYREDKLPDARQSYEMLLDPELQGRISVFDSADDMFTIASGLLGYENHALLTDAQIDDCSEMIRRLHQNVRFYWSDPTQLQQALASGEVLAAWGWTDAYLSLRGQDVPVKFMFPEERLATWMCGFVLNANGLGDEDQAYDYLNATLDPRVGKMLIDDWGYGHSNAQSYELSVSALAKELGLTGDLDRFLNGSRFMGEIEPTRHEKMNRVFADIKLGG